MRIFENWVNRICRLCAVGSGISVIALVSLIMAEIALRGLFDHSLLIVEELVGYLLSASIFFALAPTFRDGAMIRLTLVIDRVSTRSVDILEAITSGVTLSVTLFLARYVFRTAWRYYDRGITSNGVWPIPLWIPEVSALLGLAALSIVLIFNIISKIPGSAVGE